MPHAGVYILASLIPGLSAALISPSGPSYMEPRSPHGPIHDAKQGQSIYDGCRTSPCRIAYLNSVQDFCLWAPSQPTPLGTRHTEHTLVAWCTKSIHGIRLIPDGTILEARFVMTPEYVQVSGVGNLTNINIPSDGVAGVSEDVAHGLVFTSAYGQLEQIHNWTIFVSQERFCFRACMPSPAASTTCPEIHSVSGCSEDDTGNYDTAVLENCVGDVSSILYQEVLAAPPHHSAHSPSSCTIRGATAPQATRARRALPTTTITFPSSTLTTTLPMNSRSNALAPTLYSYDYTIARIHGYPHTLRIPYYRASTSSASTLPSPSFGYPPSSSSTASLLVDLSSTSSAASSVPFVTLTFPPSSSGLSSRESSTSSVTPTSTPTPTSASTSTSPLLSFYGTSSSYPVITSMPLSSSNASIPFPAATSPIPPSPSPSASSSTSSYVLTPTSSSSSPAPPISPASPSSTIPNSQAQVGSQCPPPLRFAVNVGPGGPSPLFPLMFTILMIVISSSVGILVL